MKKVLLASRNPGKIRELAAALSEAGVEVYGLDRLDGDPGEVAETGKTFEANARIKAEAYSLHTDLPVVADDSGLEVDALHGAPGVISARYGGPDLDDRGRTLEVLDEMKDVPPEKRTARFRCVLALARRGKTIALFNGQVDGIIADRPQGENGFGYDPVFFHPETGKTFAQISREHKQRLSHRGQAIRALLDAIRSGEVQL